MLVVCDFDETAAAQNVARAILEHFDSNGLDTLRARHRAGAISFRDYQERAFRQLDASIAEIEDFAASTSEMRPGFMEAVRATLRAGGEFRVVSAGLAAYVEPALARAGAAGVPVTAVKVRDVAARGGAIQYDYPEAAPGCDPGWAVCKCRPMASALREGREVIFVGDGLRSDACAAGWASTVFARGRLLQYCRANGIDARPFDDFYAIAEYVSAQCSKPGRGSFTT